MRPIALFDKSFLQSLSVDSSVWFDQFFLANICPIFYSETLANLGKEWKNGKLPEQEVGARIAAKFPDMNGFPCLHHLGLVINNLLGYAIPMTGQIPSGGKPTKSLDTSCIIHENIPEAKDFLRWARFNFTQEEHNLAINWRKDLSNYDLDTISNSFKSAGMNMKICQTLEDVKEYAESIVNRSHKSLENINVELDFLCVPLDVRDRILKRWSSEGWKSLSVFAPYAAHVLTIELFFHIARSLGLIPLTSSSWIDICYLYYVPFCMLFVSSDNLHRRCANLFMRSEQQFIWGKDLNDDLIALNKHYSNLPEEIKRKGISNFASKPPKEPRFLVAEIWDKHFPSWRTPKKNSTRSLSYTEIREEITNISNAEALPRNKINFDLNHPDSVLIRRSVRTRKGSWNIVDEELLKNNEDEAAIEEFYRVEKLSE
ncbi:MAG: hypothetical protein ACD_44C00125G0011 [uncultured bacterium]|nr:MAG: hypothetical protein ACD_44C00125G0011 [uncultured bacterium]